jgi:hypothetical protein
LSDPLLPLGEYGAFDADTRGKEFHRDEVEVLQPGGWNSLQPVAVTDNLRDGGSVVQQVGGVVQGASTIHPPRRLYALPAITAIVVIAAMVALMVWVVPLATSGVEAEGSIPKADTPWVTLYDDEGNAHRVHLRTGGAEDAPPWVRLYDGEGNVYLVHAR